MRLKKEERLQAMIDILQNAREPVSGSELAKRLEVSRQVIVQDIALLKERKVDILSTSKGYLILHAGYSTVIKVSHTKEQIADELYAVVEAGAVVEDVFVKHDIYGRLQAPLHISNKEDVKSFVSQIKAGDSPLTSLTQGVHYHTIHAQNQQILEKVRMVLDKMGILC